jgi:hypothetical protein
LKGNIGDFLVFIFMFWRPSGENGSFNTLLTYITVKENAKGVKQYSLNISDSDAMNAKRTCCQSV